MSLLVTNDPEHRRTARSLGSTNTGISVLLVLFGAAQPACDTAESAAQRPPRWPADSADSSRRADATVGSAARPVAKQASVGGASVTAAQGPPPHTETLDELARDQQPETFAMLERLADGATVVRHWRGRASYYSNRLVGRLMANGKKYESDRPYAAHRTLPFGSLIRVVRLSTGRAVVLRVMDRGPFGDRRRIVDVSRAAAERLDLLQVGVADVRVELLSEPR